MRDLLEKIKNSGNAERDLLIDDLGDYIDNNPVSDIDKLLIVNELLGIFETEDEPDVLNSIIYLVTDIYDSGIGKSVILNAVVKNMSRMTDTCLIFVVPILAEADIPNKVQLLEGLRNARSQTVREAVEEALQSLG